MVSHINLILSCYLLVLFNMNYQNFLYENYFNIISKYRYLSSWTKDY